MTVVQIGSVGASAAIDVLCEAFNDYPVMRFVMGEGDEYERRLRQMVGVFVAARVLRREPVLGVTTPGDAVVAAALVTPPASRGSSAEAGASRDRFWQGIGGGARERWELYEATISRFSIAEPHHHLNMIGVRRSHRGIGLARTLIETIEALARTHADSSGVSLTTENASNVPFYQHLGYQLQGHARVADRVDTWAFFKPLPLRS